MPPVLDYQGDVTEAESKSRAKARAGLVPAILCPILAILATLLPAQGWRLAGAIGVIYLAIWLEGK